MRCVTAKVEKHFQDWMNQMLAPCVDVDIDVGASVSAIVSASASINVRMNINAR